MLEDGLEDVENLYTTKLNDYYYTARNNTNTNNYTEEHNTHNKKCTTRNNTHNINYIKEHNMHNNNYTAKNNTHNNNYTEELKIHNKNCTEKHNTHNTSKMKAPQKISLIDTYIYTEEFPISKHWRPEVKVAKKAEMKNLQDYETFIEVKDEGQTRVGSRWVITEKEQLDGQKTKVKARLVARSFQETLKPQSDSPMAAKESFKLLMALAANSHSSIASVDICAAFLQSKG